MSLTFLEIWLFKEKSSHSTITHICYILQMCCFRADTDIYFSLNILKCHNLTIKGIFYKLHTWQYKESVAALQNAHKV